LKKIVHYLLFVSLSFLTLSVFSQEQEPVKKITVKKENEFVKAAFDDTDFKVIAFDRYGNPHTEAIKSFSVFYKEGNDVFEAAVEGNTFPQKTINFLTKKKKLATKICLVKLKAENKDGHLEALPDLCDIVIFPDCKKVNKHK
jgi:hypothetical protein